MGKKIEPYEVVCKDFIYPGGVPGYRFEISGPDADKLMASLVPDGFEDLELIVKRANIAYNAGHSARIQKEEK